MATSSFKSFLMYKRESEWEKLVDIKDYPDLGGAPELLETTTLSDPAHTYIEGIQEQEALEFNINYTPEIYETVLGLAGTEMPFAVWFGGTAESGELKPTGTEGKFEFLGTASIRVTGKGVNEVRESVITIVPSTPIAFSKEEA